MNRNPAFLEICGFVPFNLVRRVRAYQDPETGVIHLPGYVSQSPVPAAHNFSRFLSSLVAFEAESGVMSAMAVALRHQLLEALPDFGVHLGCDGKAIENHSTGHKDTSTGLTSDPDADWGKHETHGVDSTTNKVWTKVKGWFGYTLHLIADTTYEVPVAVSVTPASSCELKTLEATLPAMFEESPALAASTFVRTAAMTAGP